MTEYISKGNTELKEWMTLAETASYVQHETGYSVESAQKQVVNLLANRVLWTKWKDEAAIPRGYCPVGYASEIPPRGDDCTLWKKAELNWEDGTVRDDWGEYKPGEWRPLLIRKLARWPDGWPGPDAIADNQTAVPPRDIAELGLAQTELKPITPAAAPATAPGTTEAKLPAATPVARRAVSEADLSVRPGSC